MRGQNYFNVKYEITEDNFINVYDFQRGEIISRKKSIV
jgi:hypothetical protein